MIIPPFLRENDRVAIIATARKITLEEIQYAIEAFNSWNLEVVLGDHLLDEYNQFAGEDKYRAFDLQKVLDDESIKAVFFARGGYGTVRLLEYINFDKFFKSPKWLVGFSDLTVIHNVCSHLNVCSLHAAMPFNFDKTWKSNQGIQYLNQVLFGDQIRYQIKPNSLNRGGTIKGKLIGGNLSVLYSLAGTKYDIDSSGKILFLEDLDEYLYHIDRMMMNLKLSGKFDNLKGLIIGGMTEMNDNTVSFGKDAYNIIREIVGEYDFPVCFDFPAGHIKDNYPLIMGKDVVIDISSCEVKFIS